MEKNGCDWIVYCEETGNEDRSGKVVNTVNIKIIPIPRNDFNQLTKKEVHRTYWGIVDGIPLQKKGTINQPIGRDRHHPTRRRVSTTGQSATTYYQVVDYSLKNDRSLIQCTLSTGRTHQIRVHMKHINHPLFKDSNYGGDVILRGTTFSKYKQFKFHGVICN